MEASVSLRTHRHVIEKEKVRQHILYGTALVFLLAGGLRMPAQRQVIAMPADDGVWVRWTEPDLKGSPSINVYRQEASGGEWIKLTPQPLSYGQVDITPETARNAAVRNAKDMADALCKQGKMEGIGLALVLTTAVESREFSQYLGIIYQDKTAQAGQEYRYEVREVGAGSEKPYGQSARIKAGRLIPGMAVEEVKAQAGDGQLSFSWKPDPSRLTGAHVYYRLGAEAWKRMNQRLILPARVLDSKGEKTYPEWLFTADSLQNGVTYACMVRGVDLFGYETEASAELRLTPVDKTPPAQVGKFNLAVNAEKVTLTWDLPNARGVDGIHIYRARGADTTWTRLTKQPLSPTAKRYDDLVDEMGQVYTYAVATLDKAGNENRTEGRFVEVRDVKPPVQVRNLKAVADTGVIKLTWFPNPEKDLKGYHVYRMAKTKAGGDTIQVTRFPVTQPSYNDTLPKVAKNTFLYCVSAVDTSYNEGMKSIPATAFLPDPEPPQVPTLKAIRKESETILIVWLPNLELDLAGYIVYRATQEHGPDSIWKPLMERPLSAKDTTFADRHMEAGQAYYYRVQALDQAGNRSAMSDPFMGSITTLRLRAVPQDIQIKHGKGKPDATLTWTLPKTQDVIGCMVYRKQGKEEFLPVSGLVQEYKVTDTGLKKGNTYYYEIRAFDKVGNYSKSAPVTLTVDAE